MLINAPAAGMPRAKGRGTKKGEDQINYLCPMQTLLALKPSIDEIPAGKFSYLIFPRHCSKLLSTAFHAPFQNKTLLPI
jgi:hypothetical protein